MFVLSSSADLVGKLIFDSHLEIRLLLRLNRRWLFGLASSWKD
jgi:hypothetical protein